MSTGIIKDEHKERTNRLLTVLQDACRRRPEGPAAAGDRGDQESGGRALGEAGRGVLRLRRLPEGCDAINQALQKGQIKHQDEAYVYLGLADVQLKNTADAKKALAELKDVPNISPRVLKLWTLYAATLA